jgi:hypothetical protein
MIWGGLSDKVGDPMQHPIQPGIPVYPQAANTLDIPRPFHIPSWNALFATRTGGPDDDDDEAALVRKLMPIVAIIIVIATIFGG